MHIAPWNKVKAPLAHSNAANEVAVNAFLKNKLGFLDIPKVVEKTLNEVSCHNLDTLESVVENDQLSRQIAQSFVGSSD